MSDLAPIVLFTYKRFSSLVRTISSLKRNSLAEKSDLIIFSEAPKNHSEREAVSHVREYLKSITGFKSVQTNIATKHLGLAESVIQGVSQILQEHEHVIVLEDDLLTSPNFLTYMNEALKAYKGNSEVFSISGYSNIRDKELLNDGPDVFFSTRFSSWGWATWRDRWIQVNWTETKYISSIKEGNNTRHLHELGSDLKRMLRRQSSGKLSSWAVRFVYHQFKHKLYSVHPTRSKVSNIGFNALTATNTLNSKRRFETDLDYSGKYKFDFPSQIKIDNYYLLKLLKPYSLRSRIKEKLTTNHSIIKVKSLAKRILKKELSVTIDSVQNVEWLGNTDAGFYVYDKYLQPDSIVISCGVGEDISFDEELISGYNVIVHGFDPTPKSAEYVSKRIDLVDNYILHPYGIYNFDGDVKFNLPKNDKFVSGRIQMGREVDDSSRTITIAVRKLKSILSDLKISKIDLLKMDIEGSEYIVIDDLLKDKIEVKQLCVEFHHWMPGFSCGMTMNSIIKLKGAGYKLVGVSPGGHEFTFLRANL